MRLATAALLAALLVGLLGPLTATGQQGVGLSLRILGESPQANGDGQPVLVAGVWHALVVSLDAPLTGRLEVEATSLEASTQDMSSHYLWVRDEGSGTWSDPLYGVFVEGSRSVSDGETVTFVAGMDAAASPGPWRLAVRLDGVLLATQDIEVRAPRIDYGLSAADFQFRAEPFQAARLSSIDQHQYLRVWNQGNVPLRLTMSFDWLQDRLALSNPSEVAHVGTDVRYYLTLDLDSRPPQIAVVEGTSRVEVLHRIPSPGATLLVPSVEGSFRVTLTVGRSGYVVRTLGSVVFQTLETLQADYGATVTWQVFLTGDQPVSLDVEVTNARLGGVFQGERPVALPVDLALTPDAELPLALQVRTDIPDTTAEVLFTLRLLRTGEIQTFRTTIQVGPRPAPTGVPPSYLWLFASLVSASVLVLMSYNQWRFESFRGTGGGARSRTAGRWGRPRQPRPENRRGTKARKDRKQREGRRGGPSGHGKKPPKGRNST